MRKILLPCLLLATLSAQESLFQPSPQFKPLLNGPTTSGARADWIRITNQQYQMSGKGLRVAAEGSEGLTLVVLAPGVEKYRHAKPILLGKDDYALLFRSAVAEGFNRMVVRNPDNGKQWAARIEKGKAIIED